MTLTDHTAAGAGVLVAGAGLAAQRAVETLRRSGYDGPIRVLGEEPEPPYDRPPLSKDFLAGRVDETALRFRDDGWYDANGVDLVLGDRADALDPRSREVVLASGRRLAFAQLLIATGSRPRLLPGTEGFGNVCELRGLGDARRLRDVLAQARRVVVVGAGFIGQEVASTARALGVDVTIVEAAPAPLATVLGADVGRWFARLHRDEGIDVRLSAQIRRFHGVDEVRRVELDDGRTLGCDAVVVGVGTVPATAWLAGSGLDEAGVRVDATGRTAMEGVYAAGDAGRPFDARRGEHVRTEHWEAAARQGADAARAMLGLPPRPATTPSFWSDQHGLRIQYLGDARGADGLQVDGDPAARDFSVTYTERGRPIAALLVGRPHALPAARRKLEQAGPSSPERTAA